MQYTDVYNLKKPDLNDLPTIRDINENMEVIEEALPSYIKVLYGETVPTSRIPGKFYLISLDETNTNYRVEDSEGNIVHSETNDENVVHKTGDETINGVKSFGSMIKATNGTVQVGADTGYSVTFNYNGNITSKQARGTYNIFFPEGNGTLALTSDLDSKANDNNVVHKSGDETITGVKTFTDRIISNKELQYRDTKYDWTDTSLNVWCDAGSVAWFDKTGNRRMHELVGANGGIWRKACYINENQYFSVDSNRNISYEGTSLKWNGKNVALDENLVHRTGDEHIHDTKMFSNTIHRYADLTTSGGVQVYRFVDTNANGCGHIYNNALWHNKAVYNRHGAYNAKSGKTLELDLITNDFGRGTAYISGTVTDLGNLTDATPLITERALATMGWVNNPATSTNVVHRSGDETIAGVKTFSSKIVGNLQGNADTAGSAGNGIDSSGANYVKFKDGTQICWGSNVHDNIVTFANAFTTTPYISFGYNIGSDFIERIHGQARYASSTSFAMLVWNFDDNNWETGRNVEWIAIGRWK